VLSSTAVATLCQLVMLIINKVVEDDHRLLLANKLESTALPNGTTQALCPAARDASSFEVFCLSGPGNEERPQFLQLVPP
jgi:hypothetical protein